MRYIISAFLLMCLSAGAQAQTHQVALSWPASTSTGVTGYNVYRLANSCPAQVTLSAFAKLATTTALTYTDTPVTAGNTFCYVVTTLTATAESAASGTLQATIPVFTASTVPVPPASITSQQQ